MEEEKKEVTEVTEEKQVNEAINNSSNLETKENEDKKYEERIRELKELREKLDSSRPEDKEKIEKIEKDIEELEKKQKLWNNANGRREEEFSFNEVTLLEKAENFINYLYDEKTLNGDSEEEKRSNYETAKNNLYNEFIEELNMSSALSSMYVLNEIKRERIKANDRINNCTKLIDVMLEKRDKKEASGVNTRYDPVLNDFIPENGESRKSRL